MRKLRIEMQRRLLRNSYCTRPVELDCAFESVCESCVHVAATGPEFARTGLFTAHTETRAWTIPVHRALCVPDGSRLRIETARRVGIRCLCTRAELALLGDEVRVVNLDPLTHELISHAVDTAPMNLDEPADTALITLLADQLSRLPDALLQLPLPTDPTAMAVAAAIMAQPAASLHDQLRTAAASRRTLERRFKTETRMSLGQWRRIP